MQKIDRKVYRKWKKLYKIEGNIFFVNTSYKTETEKECMNMKMCFNPKEKTYFYIRKESET